MSMDEFHGIKLKDAFYTAGYRDYSTERMLGGLNHSETFVFDGKQFPSVTEADVLVRTGNGIAGIEPVIRAIDETGEFDDFVGYQTRTMPQEMVEIIDKTLELMETYEKVKKMHERMGKKEHPLIIKMKEMIGY